MSVRILTGDCRDVLRTLPDESVHCVVTSPPYWGLRDYGTAEWEGGDEGCDHVEKQIRTGLGLAALGEQYRGGGHKQGEVTQLQYGTTCPKCGAIRIDQQIGLEPTIDEYLANMVEVFREVRRVLRDDGTCWVNMGDSYAMSSMRGIDSSFNDNVGAHKHYKQGSIPLGSRTIPNGLKPKDLCGIPWRLALALQANGWWLRSDIIWAKPNPMPESVADRPTKAHEYLFLLSKAARYFYDAEAVREEEAESTKSRNRYNRSEPKWAHLRHGAGFLTAPAGKIPDGRGRNRRTVWTIATSPFPEAHFATFPPALVEPCIKAGTSERGVCPVCGAGWERIRQKTGEYQAHWKPGAQTLVDVGLHGNTGVMGDGMINTYTTIGWRPTCTCDAGDPIPATCLDPFGGAGTTALVADRLGRDAILIELNEEYAQMARRRIIADAGMFAEVDLQ